MHGDAQGDKLGDPFLTVKDYPPLSHAHPPVVPLPFHYCFAYNALTKQLLGAK